jgi:hypothetical protein
MPEIGYWLARPAMVFHNLRGMGEARQTASIPLVILREVAESMLLFVIEACGFRDYASLRAE